MDVALCQFRDNKNNNYNNEHSSTLCFDKRQSLFLLQAFSFLFVLQSKSYCIVFLL